VVRILCHHDPTDRNRRLRPVCRSTRCLEIEPLFARTIAIPWLHGCLPMAAMHIIVPFATAESGDLKEWILASQNFVSSSCQGSALARLR
jgi:hypothetical protein